MKTMLTVPPESVYSWGEKVIQDVCFRRLGRISPAILPRLRDVSRLRHLALRQRLDRSHTITTLVALSPAEEGFSWLFARFFWCGNFFVSRLRSGMSRSDSQRRNLAIAL
jgi:hypothetical protein